MDPTAGVEDFSDWVQYLVDYIFTDLDGDDNRDGSYYDYRWDLDGDDYQINVENNVYNNKEVPVNGKFMFYGYKNSKRRLETDYIASPVEPAQNAVDHWRNLRQRYHRDILRIT